MLTLTKEQIAQLSRQAQKCYPEECCGLLLGQGKVVKQGWETVNVWTPQFAETLQTLAPADPDKTRCNRFAIAPEDILAAQKYARNHQLAIIGIYHSHPDYPAIPSEYDRAIAWEIYSYVILSVQQNYIESIRSWVLDGDRNFQEEPIKLLNA